ncbi:MAG: hypothetical protein HYU66_14710 [Armatimonadetes bacterium]|nr:hypothetical protein [Armatimonadota bacterium]
MRTALREAARQGRADAVIPFVADCGPSDRQALLRLVCHDYHTIRKREGHVRLAAYLLADGAEPELGLVFEVARGGQAELRGADKRRCWSMARP